MISIKRGVDLTGLQPQMLVALAVVQSLFREEFAADVVITSANDGEHEHVLHHVGQALDFRTRHMLHMDRVRVEGALKGMLGDQFDVVLEEDHLHVEYDPR